MTSNVVVDGDWWVLGEELAQRAAGVAGIELPKDVHRLLVEMLAELMTLITSWPTQTRPAAPLAYLRWRRARMSHHVPWLYDLPRPTRWLLIGTDHLPSLLECAITDPDLSRSARRQWRRGLLALIQAHQQPPAVPGFALSSTRVPD